MNKYLKEFFLRGLTFGGFGPIVFGIVLCIISKTKNITFDGAELLLGIISIYLLAFVHAGVSVVNNIEHWSTTKSSLVHLSLLYVAYLSCYLLNSWIPFHWLVVIIFTLMFVLVYFVIWITVYLIDKKTTLNLNRKIKEK